MIFTLIVKSPVLLYRNLVTSVKSNIGLGCRLISTQMQSPEGVTVKIEDQTIHYETVGNGKHHVFLMPGALGSSRLDFSMQLERLDREKFTVVAWDPPGYGHSRPPDRKFPIDFFHQDARVASNLLTSLGITKTSVVGWSDGGITALILAAQNPDLMEKLVVFGANSYVSEKDILLYEGVRDINKWSQRMRTPMVDTYGEEYFKSTWNRWIDAMISIHKMNQGDICRKELKQIKCPTLVIHGSKDAMVPRFHPVSIKENIPNAKFIEWEDGKHNLHMQFADKFNETVEQFLLR